MTCNMNVDVSEKKSSSINRYKKVSLPSKTSGNASHHCNFYFSFAFAGKMNVLGPFGV